MSFGLPSAANAETWWLMAAGKFNQAAGSTAHNWAIPTNSEKGQPKVETTNVLGIEKK